jgi:hypothetical protein
MSMQDARLDHLMLRIEAIERALGMSDDPPEGVTTIVSRLEAAERDICDLEARRDNRESDETWATVRKLVAHRVSADPPASGSLVLGYREVRVLADLIEGEWGKL